MLKKEIEIFYPESKSKWRKWLQKNHISTVSVWLIFYKKKTTYAFAINEGIKFVWWQGCNK